MTNPEEVNIDKLFQRIPMEHEVLCQKLREEARAVLLEKRNSELLDSNELQDLWNILEKYKSKIFNGKYYITYTDFLKASEEVIPKAKRYFKASIFAKLIHADPLSRVELLSFFNYIMKTVWFQQTRIGISLYDVTGEGFLRENDLDNYITELLPTLHQLKAIDETFRTFYVCTAVRKFFFFLDPLRTSRIRITDILASGFLDCMLELRDSNISQERLAANWFSHQSAMRVYGGYLLLDTDRNGMLSRSELARFANGTLTNVFLDRVFQECLTYGGEMDYKAYLDFVLALENKQEPQSLTFIFRILDLGGQGRLSSRTLEYFFDGVLDRIKHEHGVPKSVDIANEIFDMVRPTTPDYITLDDLIRSGKGETVISILIDLQGFLLYENREALTTEFTEEALL